MGRTRTQVRNEVARQLGLPFVSGTAGTFGVSSITHTALGRFADKEIIGLYIYPTNGTPTSTNLVITNFVQSTGVASFSPTITVNGATTYEILPFPADAIHDAINDALLMLFQQGILSRDHWVWAVSGSPIYNANMAHWTSSTALDGWTGGTIARQQGAALKWVGEDTARITAGNLTLDATWARFLADSSPGSLRLHAWLNASAATGGRVSILQDGAASVSSGYHEGDSDWHLVSTTSLALTAGETDISVRIERAAGNVDVGLIWVEGSSYPVAHPLSTAYFPNGPTNIFSSDLGVDTTNLRARVIPRGARLETGWTFVKYHDEAASVEQGLIRWSSGRPEAGRLLWISGRAPVTLPTADAGVLEINQPEEVLLAKVSALALLDQNLNTPSLATRERKARLARDIEMLIRASREPSDVVTLGRGW